MENNLAQPDQKVELIDVVDSDLLVSTRPKPTRGRPPGSPNKNKAVPANNLEADPLFDVAAPEPVPGVAARINGRPTRSGKNDRANPVRLNSDKPIFTLSVAAEILALHPRTLRIYEEHGLVVPHRTPTQRRLYSQNDVKKFQFIQFLTQRRRVNLEGVKIILVMLDQIKVLGVEDPVKYVFDDYQEAN